MTISNHEENERTYWDKLVRLLREETIAVVMQDAEVEKRCRQTVDLNRAYESFLKQYTQVVDAVAVTDFRSLETPPTGNRFLVYSLFPECVVHVKIRHDINDRDKTLISVGHSIFNRNCRVNVGDMLSRFGGGGHPGAGACSCGSTEADQYIKEIIDILVKNEPAEVTH